MELRVWYLLYVVFSTYCLYSALRIVWYVFYSIAVGIAPCIVCAAWHLLYGMDFIVCTIRYLFHNIIGGVY